MQYYNDFTLYFSVLPRDFVAGHLDKFCFNFRGLRRYRTITAQEHAQLSFDPDGNLIATLWNYKVVNFYNCTSGLLVKQIPFMTTTPRCCVVDKKGRHYIAVGKKIVQSYNCLIDVGHLVAGLAVCDDRLYACTLAEGIKVFSTETHKELETLFTSVPCQSVAVAKRGLVVGCRAGVYIPTGFISAVLTRHVALDCDDNIYVPRALCQEVRVFTIDGLPLGEIPFEFKNPFGIAISQTGVVAVSDDDGIHLFQ